MRIRIAAISGALVLLTAGIAAAHDLFIKPVNYFVAENSDVMVRVLNGTFSKSENGIERSRLADVSVVSPSGRTALDTSVWDGSRDTSTFAFRTGDAGTYVLGASIRPSVIGLEAKEFNAYLRDDGIPDVLEARRKAKQLGRAARERYSKHVKAIVQVGDRRSENYAVELGYPAEIVPVTNPYALKAGQRLRVRTFVGGESVARQHVVYGGRLPNGARIAARSTRSDAQGIATIPLRAAGTWYIKFINMERVEADTVDYESRWATLTFQVR